MPAGGAETERLHPLLRDLGRVDLRDPDGVHVFRTESSEQLLQAGSAIVDESAERYNLRLVPARYVQEVGLDSLVGGDGESCDLVLPCSERLHRALPANLPIDLSRRSRWRRRSLPKKTVGGEIVHRDRDHETFDSRGVTARVEGQDIVCQERFLDISACAEQLAGRRETLGDLVDDSPA